MERRNFLKATCALCGIAVIPGVLDSCKKTPSKQDVNFTIDITNSAYTALQTVGGSAISNGVLIMRVDSSSFSAVASSCTHEGCAVGYQASSKQVVCPCHGGRFDVSGAVVAGPPKTALQKFNVTQNGNTLSITS